MQSTPNAGMPLLQSQQAQKYITHNQALLVIDALLNCAVESRSLTAPPATPADGARYVVATAATGGWAGKDGTVAAWSAGAWNFYPPQPGLLVFVRDESLLLLFDGTGFRAPLLSIPELGVNATPSATNRLAVAADATLLTAETADHRLVVNKAAEAATASLLLQDGYSGRAEIGLAGDDNLTVKVSADGSTWHEAVVVDPGTGSIGIGGQIRFPAPQNASSDARTLDDYQEGSYSPAIAAGSGALGATTINAALFRKIGSFVHVQYDFTITDNGTGAAYISLSLPFAAAYPAAGGGGMQINDSQYAVMHVILSNSAVAIQKSADGSYVGFSNARFVGSFGYIAAV